MAASSSSFADRQVLVILDTNVWIKHQLLTSPTAAALLHAVERLNGHIGVPEIVSMELPEVLARLVEEATHKALTQVELIARVMGKTSSFVGPSREEVFTAVDSRLQNLKTLLEELPFSLELVKSALARVVRGSPPNSLSNEQFRDSLILEIALAAGRDYDVHFITGDKGFFQERKLKKGAAVEIRSLISEQGLAVSIYADLAECVDRLAPTSPEIDSEKALLQIAGAIASEVNSESEKRLFSVSLVRADKLILSATKNPGIVSASFDLLYVLDSLPQGETLGRQNAHLQVLGDCYYDFNHDIVSKSSLDQLCFTYEDAEGKPQRHFVKYLRASVNAGGSLGDPEPRTVVL